MSVISMLPSPLHEFNQTVKECQRYGDKQHSCNHRPDRIKIIAALSFIAGVGMTDTKISFLLAGPSIPELLKGGHL